MGVILHLQKQFEVVNLEQRNVELAERNDKLSRRIEELEKKNPTVRLYEA
jgi:cell division protein FtsB